MSFCFSIHACFCVFSSQFRKFDWAHCVIGVLFRVCNFDFCLHECSCNFWLLVNWCFFFYFFNLKWAWRLFLNMIALVFCDPFHDSFPVNISLEFERYRFSFMWIPCLSCMFYLFCYFFSFWFVEMGLEDFMPLFLQVYLIGSLYFLLRCCSDFFRTALNYLDGEGFEEWGMQVFVPPALQGQSKESCGWSAGSL